MSAKQTNKKEETSKKLSFSGSCLHNSPLTPFFLSLVPIHTSFSSSSITPHLVSISQGPLSVLPAYYVSSMWAGRKSLERSEPFISGGDLICVQQDAPFQCEGAFVHRRLCEIVIAAGWTKLLQTKNLLPEMSFSSAVYTLPLNPACCHLPLSRRCWHGGKNRIFGILFFAALICLISLMSVRRYQSKSSRLINLPHSILNYIASLQSNHTLR